MSTSNRNDGSGSVVGQDVAGAVEGNGDVSGTAKFPDPEVSSLPKRRRFSADYKVRVADRRKVREIKPNKVPEIGDLAGVRPPSRETAGREFFVVRPPAECV